MVPKACQEFGVDSHDGMLFLVLRASASTTHMLLFIFNRCAYTVYFIRGEESGTPILRV